VINIVVALPAEARPLIRHFRLHDKHRDTGFPVHQGKDVTLVISGPGKVAAAAATAALGSRHDPRQVTAWLNLGIAGHATHRLGTGVIACRITDQATGKSWYPPQIMDLGMPGGDLHTVDCPEDSYAGDTLYDMEASGFYPVACRYTTSELVQCYKIISDNREQRSEGVTAKLCEQLVASRIDTIERLVTALARLARECTAWHTPHPDLDRLTGHWHFTVAQQHQLTRLSRRWQALQPGLPLWSRELASSKSAAEVLHRLGQHLDTLAVELA
jgi:hypothetical protein